jgi:cephalosporin-C deacetylase-like acetyl esterase
MAFVLLLATAGWFSSASAGEVPKPLVEQLRALDAGVLTRQQDAAARDQLRRMLSDDVRTRLRAANQNDLASWRQLKSREDWEAFRDMRIAALRRSLGEFPPQDALESPAARIIRVSEGEGFRISNIVYTSRPGVLVTANLYQPHPLREAMPGILICHSHHNPKTQGELQDMGMTWARQGCYVLVPDQLGHGERRQHPFRSAADFRSSFRVDRQDYYFRYHVAAQLHLVGESLIGLMAHDLMRGVDVLLKQQGIAADKIILLGAVAGGGDPAAVTAALDPRISAVVPFNFGGPQPETIFPLPADAETAFNYAGGGSWESTRNLRLSARDGFFPWVIVGSLAPRRLIYAHEFAWDRERDPVWKRLNAIFQWYNKPERLAFVFGRGNVRLSSNEATHCNNIGPPHRAMIYPALEEWFGIPPPQQEYRQRREAAELLCLDGITDESLGGKPIFSLAGQMADRQLLRLRSADTTASPAQRATRLQRAWREVLGDIERYEPNISPGVVESLGDVRVERFVIGGQRAVVVPCLALWPPQNSGETAPLVVMFCQQGKAALLRERADAIAELLQRGIAVCLPDLRGTGETAPEGDRGRQSTATSISSSELMLGQALLGSRLADLRTVLAYCRTLPQVDSQRIALWGDSTATPNEPDPKRLRVPLGSDYEPRQAEPAGHILALLCGLYEPQLAALVTYGGLTSYRDALHDQFVWLPHDVVLPGAIPAGDLPDVAAALAPRRLYLAGMVDGLNRSIAPATAHGIYAVARQAYAAWGDERRIVFGEHTGVPAAYTLGKWLTQGTEP